MKPDVWQTIGYAGATLVVSLLLSVYLVPICRDAAARFGLVDRPDCKLKNQEHPVPYLGGLAVFSSVLLPAAVFLQFSDTLMGLLLASSIVVLLGLIDDIGRLSPRIKLLGQVIAVFLMIKSGIRIRVGFLPPLLCVALTFLWMLLLTNGFNLIDVMDGLAGGIGSIAAVSLATVFFLQGNLIGVVISVSLTGALLGFLHYNRPPAQIYLGDTGSLFLGFLLGGLAIGGKYTILNRYGWVTAIAIFGVPLFEIAFLSYIRIRRGVPVMAGSHDHFSLRLRKWRLTTGQTVVASCAFAAASAAVGILAMHMSPAESLYLYGTLVVMFFAVAIFLKAIDMSM